jgi:hypothetical protein
VIPKRWEFNSRHHGFHTPIDFVALKAAIVSYLFEVGPQTADQIEKGLKGTPGVSRSRQAIRYLKEEGTIERDDVHSPWKIARRTVK